MKVDTSLKGVIFDIQKFSLHDGPGIRTTIFFKGCNLSCQWCHNPESISSVKQLSYKDDKCTFCGECITVCPNKIHKIDSSTHRISFNKCTSCGLCVDYCPAEALSIIGREVTIEEILIEAEKDKKYYLESGGGVTLSGGECTVQFEFILELLKELRRRGINTCIETNAMLPKNSLSTLAEYVDIFLLDYKLTDSELHRHYTGKSNFQVLENLKILDSLDADVILRCPVIPGINDDELHLSAITEISKYHKCIKQVEIMPYHNLGRDKWRQIGKEYRLYDLENVSNSKVSEWKNFIQKHGGKIISPTQD